MLTKTEAEAKNTQIAHEWAVDFGIEFLDVDLADTMAYDLLTLLGRAWLTAEGALEE